MTHRAGSGRNRILITVLSAALLAGLMLLTGCFDDPDGGEPSGGSGGGQSQGGNVEREEKFSMENATGMIFRYDQDFADKFYLEACVENVNDDGADVTIEKRLGEMNYTGHTHKETFHISREQVDEIFAIVGSYDILAYSKLRTRGYGYSPTRWLTVWFPEENVSVPWDAIFPETLPPEEDIMYFEIYSFFNGLIYDREGWEEVRSDDLGDPRDNPAYYDRTVTQYGKEVHLMPGTGIYSEDGTGALIDYGDKLWWVEEGFTGTWVMRAGENGNFSGIVNKETATFTVREDGTVTLETDGEVYTGALDDKRYYRSSITMSLTSEDVPGAWFNFTIEPMSIENYKELLIYYRSEPYPEPQYAPVGVFVTKQ